MDTQERYSPGLWPPTALPLPRVHLGVLNELGGGWFRRGFDKHDQLTDTRFEEPPLEMHLREIRDVDVSDPQALVGLVEAIGDPVDPEQPWRGFVNPRRLLKIAEREYPLHVENVARQVGIATPETWADRPDEAFHVSEVAHMVVMVRLLTSHLVRALDGEPTAPTWQAAGFMDLDEDWPPAVLHGFDEEPAEAVAWYYFAEMMNDALVPFSARVIGPAIRSQPEVRDITTAYSAACLLIFNDLADGLPYRRCADETCGRVFRRQLGRSSGQFHRSEGVAYCTPQHARNQAQRERRRRDRQARGNGES